MSILRYRGTCTYAQLIARPYPDRSWFATAHATLRARTSPLPSAPNSFKRHLTLGRTTAGRELQPGCELNMTYNPRVPQDWAGLTAAVRSFPCNLILLIGQLHRLRSTTTCLGPATNFWDRLLLINSSFFSIAWFP